MPFVVKISSGASFTYLAFGPTVTVFATMFHFFQTHVGSTIVFVGGDASFACFATASIFRNVVVFFVVEVFIYFCHVFALNQDMCQF